MRYILHILFFSLLTPLSNIWAEEGEIWQVAEQKFISEKVLLARLALSKNIIIGIRPDNPEHHRGTARLIEKLTKAGQKPVILVTSIERSKQNAFAIFRQRHHEIGKEYDATGLDMLLNWSQSGQPDWVITRPLFDMAMLKKIPIKAVNFSRYEIGQLHLNGLDGLPEDLKVTLQPLLARRTKGQATSRTKEKIRKEYCDTLPPEVLAKFVVIRQARESLFALAMTATGPKTAVLIMPQNYVEKDTGVPRILKDIGDAGETISLSFVETGQNIRDRNVDFIWVTAKIPRPRPCQTHLTN
ncbi:MAG: hypothetical protein COB54_04335 [Alphaproteobacteria bacterium]|nr:MAG: hypothetical protein COB54_04335 [Alphaproteobacteria bacterium]